MLLLEVAGIMAVVLVVVMKYTKKLMGIQCTCSVMYT
jgi:hypothetical protein